MDAHRNGSVIRVTCPYDKNERYFIPEELKRAYGNIEVDDLFYMLKCSRCGSNVDVESEKLPAEKRQKVTMRRLVEVYYVRKARWRDERSE